MSAERTEALEVLRQIWRSQGQTAADLDESGPGKSCKRMTDAGVGFDDFAGGEAEEAGRDLRAAWRNRLEREGKLNHSAGSVRDLILGPRGPEGPKGPEGPEGPNEPTDPAGPTEHV